MCCLLEVVGLFYLRDTVSQPNCRTVLLCIDDACELTGSREPTTEALMMLLEPAAGLALALTPFPPAGATEYKGTFCGIGVGPPVVVSRSPAARIYLKRSVSCPSCLILVGNHFTTEYPTTFYYATNIVQTRLVFERTSLQFVKVLCCQCSRAHLRAHYM